MKINFGMKAAPLFMNQLRDRIEKFVQLKINPAIELHLFGKMEANALAAGIQGMSYARRNDK